MGEQIFAVLFPSAERVDIWKAPRAVIADDFKFKNLRGCAPKHHRHKIAFDRAANSFSNYATLVRRTGGRGKVN